MTGQDYPRVYVKEHPWIDYYQETPAGTLFTPKTAIKHISLDCVITKEGATFSEIVEKATCENQPAVG